ncbi:MAG: TonB-dependent receptor [Cryomorphaceae bacterium]|nr:MAG: TonB-dependent receptor [Cryomorphaceae bacterium]
MKRLFLYIFFLVNLSLNAQKNYTLSGYVLDSQSNELIIGSSVIVEGLNIGTITNSYGFFSITIEEGNYNIRIQNLGFKDNTQNINLNKNLILNIFLTEEVESLNEVIVVENSEDIDIDLPVLSLNILSGKTIRQTPVVFGESDILKTIQLLPGVSSAGEGASGFNVRGGAADQNLILFDEAIIYNSSHLFGLFSVFNSDAIKEVKLFKGGIPSSYGGRLSSVLDVYQKDGNNQKTSINGGIGAISSRFLIEGPIQKNQSSFLVASRGTYAHLFLKLTDIENIAYFYDINTKSNFVIDNRNKIFLSGYFGRDLFKLDGTFMNTYGNSTLNFRWNHLINDKTFSNTSLIFSDYYYGLELDFVGFDWKSGIKNLNLKFDLKNYYSNEFQFNYGLNFIYYDFNPGTIGPLTADSGFNFSKLNKKFAFENSTYFDVLHKISNRLSMRYGIRINQFLRLRQNGLQKYIDNNPLFYDIDLGIYDPAKPLANNFDNNSSVFKTYNNIEPRINISYSFNNQSIKASYNRLNQYLHLISNTSSPTPLDIWVPSGPYIKPQKLDQFAFGYFKRMKKLKIETEIFYKKIKNRLDYIDGADLVANDNIETVILAGKSRAYGIEFLLKKSDGRHKFWLAYTLSKSEQKTAGRNSSENGINMSEWYNTPYDKPHDISINSEYRINKKLKIVGNFIFQTGQPTNYPNSQYTYMNLNVPNYGKRNSQRLPNYHRMDVNLTLNTEKKNKKVESSWVFGIYNLYNRDNASSIIFRRNNETLKNEAVQISIFGIVPSVTYNFKF